MTGPLEQRLERIAAKANWRLRWKSGSLVAHPRMTCTELDIFQGKRLVTIDGPVVAITIGSASPRETIAEVVLRALPRRSRPPSSR